MTSRSRRKPRTTRRSIRRLASEAVAALGVAALVAAGVIEAGEWRTFLRGGATAPDAVAPVIGDDADGQVQSAVGPGASGGAVPVSAAGACAEDDAACSAELEKLRRDRLQTIDLDITVSGLPGSDYPCECRLEGETFQPRRFAATTFTWNAAGYCHKPLYFEHWTLERYGHSHGLVADSFCSAAHFFVTLPVLPYKMGVELPWECVYPLGYYRPGSCAPWTVPAVPISPRGFAVEAATITGLVFLLP